MSILLKFSVDFRELFLYIQTSDLITLVRKREYACMSALEERRPPRKANPV